MIEEKLLKYKEVSLRIIEALKSDEDGESLFDEREEILKSIFESANDKQKAKEIYLSLGLKEIDKNIETIIKEEMRKTKVEIVEVQKRKNAQVGYSAYNRKTNLFSTKI